VITIVAILAFALHPTAPKLYVPMPQPPSTDTTTAAAKDGAGFAPATAYVPLDDFEPASPPPEDDLMDGFEPSSPSHEAFTHTMRWQSATQSSPSSTDTSSPARQLPAIFDERYVEAGSVMQVGTRVRLVEKSDSGLPGSVLTGSVINMRVDKLSGEREYKVSKDGLGDAEDEWVLDTDPRMIKLSILDEKDARSQALALSRETAIRENAMQSLQVTTGNTDIAEECAAGWATVKDPHSGDTYYWHPATNKVQWEIPFEDDLSDRESFTTVDDNEMSIEALALTNEIAPHLKNALIASQSNRKPRSRAGNDNAMRSDLVTVAEDPYDKVE
jgi:hypothetical protein